MYGFSTKLDAEVYGCDRVARIIHVAEGTLLTRYHPPHLPHSRSILGLYKNGSDAERRAEHRAELFADLRAVAYADTFAENQAGVRAKIR